MCCTLQETSPEPLLIKEDSDVATNPDHLFDSASEAVTRQNSEKTVKVQEPEVSETIHVTEQEPQATPEQVVLRFAPFFTMESVWPLLSRPGEVEECTKHKH